MQPRCTTTRSHSYCVNANDKATSLRVDNRSDKLPTSLIPGSKMKKGRKAMIFWSPAADTTSGTESNNAGTDSKEASTTKLPGDRETLFFYNMRKFLPPRKKTATMPFCKSPFRSYQGVLATGCITQESRRKGQLQLQVSQQGNQLTLKNPTAII